ncbi:MAG: hypothetical protein KA716_08495 [Gloeotrichia echinulata DEX184]|nr:hypothetical protein [Gloeotrichia echinulata DEX184]
MRQLLKSAVTIFADGAANYLKTMPKGKVAMSLCIPLLLVEGVFAPSAHALDGEKLYQLCSRFPLNSQCKDYQVPVALDNRAGKTGDCIFKNNEVEIRGNCKIVVNDAGITIYQETGTTLKVIDDKKSTRTVQITPASVTAIQYREDTRDNTEGRIVNTILFGIGGLFTPDQKVSEIEINYTSTTPQDTSQGQSVNSLKVIVGRQTGRELRSQLEKFPVAQAENSQVKPQQPNPEPTK